MSMITKLFYAVFALLFLLPNLALAGADCKGFAFGQEGAYGAPSCVGAITTTPSHARRKKTVYRMGKNKQRKNRLHRRRTRTVSTKQRYKIRLMQRLLAKRNYKVGRLKGVMDAQTRRSMRGYARKYNIRPSKKATIMKRVLAHLLKNNRKALPLNIAFLPVSAPPAVFRPSALRGAKFAMQCEGCHSFKQGGGHRNGPNLYGVMGQFIGSAGQYNYSETLKFQMTMGKTWNKEEMDCFLKDPQGCKPGTKMGFVGVKNKEHRADLIAFLSKLGQ